MAHQTTEYAPSVLLECNHFGKFPLTTAYERTINTVAILPTKVTCEVLYDKDAVQSMDVLERNTMLVYHISKFCKCNATPSELLVSTAGLLANMCCWNDLKPWEEIKIAFRDVNLDIEFKEITRLTLWDMKQRDDVFQSVLKSLLKFEKILEESNYVLILSLVILASIGEGISNTNLWFETMFKDIAEELGEVNVVEFQEKTRPSNFVIKQFSAAIRSSRSIRTQLFRTMVTIARNRNENKITVGLRKVIQMLHGCEMKHLGFIEEYLFRQFPDVRQLSFLRGLDQLHERAVGILSNCPSDEVMYAMLLKSPEETSLLDHRNFEIYIAAAIACAKYQNPNFENNYTSGNKSLQNVVVQVTDYLRNRNNLDYLE